MIPNEKKSLVRNIRINVVDVKFVEHTVKMLSLPLSSDVLISKDFPSIVLFHSKGVS